MIPYDAARGLPAGIVRHRRAGVMVEDDHYRWDLCAEDFMELVVETVC